MAHEENENKSSEMTETWDLFYQRKKEIQDYMDFIYWFIDEKADFLTSSQTSRKYPVPQDLRKTLLATLYLLLYNLVEATIRNAIKALHKALEEQEGVLFDDLKDNLKRVIIKNFRKAETLASDVYSAPIAKKLLSVEYCDFRSLFSGNVDAKKIKEILERYGVPDCLRGVRREKRGECLKEIKDRRNSLAHGHDSFQALGGRLSIDEARKEFNETILFLEIIIEGVDNFVANGDFRS